MVRFEEKWAKIFQDERGITPILSSLNCHFHFFRYIYLKFLDLAFALSRILVACICFKSDVRNAEIISGDINSQIEKPFSPFQTS